MAESTAKLAVLCVGVWLSFTIFGWATEALTSTPYGEHRDLFRFTWFLVFLQSFGNTLVGLLGILATPWPAAGAGSGARVSLLLRLTGGVPARRWMIAGLAYLGAHKFNLLSLHNIIFPMQVLVKSCKAIPVMFGEVIFEHHVSLTADKLASVALLTSGVATFTLGKHHISPASFISSKDDEGKAFHIDERFVLGMVYVVLALMCDGIYGPYQNRIKTKAVKDGFQVSAFHNMFNMNLWQGIVAFLACMCNGEVAQVWEFARRHPEVLPELAKFSVAMAVGNLFIFKMQSDFGALVVTKTTTVRKLISVLFSVWYFKHPMNALQWLGVFLVFSSEPVARVLGGKTRTH